MILAYKSIIVNMNFYQTKIKIMIKPIEKLAEQSSKYIKDFMLNCTIEEKIDTHYVCVEIISKNEIKIKKANGKEIDRVDLILGAFGCGAFRNNPEIVAKAYKDVLQDYMYCFKVIDFAIIDGKYSNNYEIFKRILI